MHRTQRLPWSRPLADFVAPAVAPIMARRGFGMGSLILLWDEIAGERLGPVSRPVKLRRQGPRQTEATGAKFAGATLVVRVEPGFALELQHLAPLVIERVNAQLGWRCVNRLRLEQGPVVRSPSLKRPASPAKDGCAKAADRLIGSGVDEPLRRALRRLGAHILSGS